MNYLRLDQAFELEAGGSLPSITIAYHTYGRLNADGSNVVWVCHALTANSDVVRWWPGVVGDKGAVRPEDHFIVCANILGSCYGSSGPVGAGSGIGEHGVGRQERGDVQRGAEEKRSADGEGASSVEGGTGREGALSVEGGTGREGALSVEGSTGREGASSVEGGTGREGALSVEGGTGREEALSVEGGTGREGALSVEGSTGREGALSVEGGADGEGALSVEGGTGREEALSVEGSTGREGASNVEGGAGREGASSGARGADGELPLYSAFPMITIRDMVRAHILLRKHLGIERIQLLMGGSMGGYQALEWVLMEPEVIGRLFLVATSPAESAWGIAVHTAQRLAIEADVSWRDASPEAGQKGLKAARAIGILTYRNYAIMVQKQTDADAEKVDGYRASSYIDYQGKKLVERFNAYCYWLLTKAMDSHNISRGRGGDIEAVLRGIRQKTLVIGITSDILCPFEEQRHLAAYLPDAQLIEIDSAYGHDGFMVEGEKIASHLRDWLKN